MWYFKAFLFTYIALSLGVLHYELGGIAKCTLRARQVAPRNSDRLFVLWGEVSQTRPTTPPPPLRPFFYKTEVDNPIRLLYIFLYTKNFFTRLIQNYVLEIKKESFAKFVKIRFGAFLQRFPSENKKTKIQVNPRETPYLYKRDSINPFFDCRLNIQSIYGPYIMALIFNFFSNQKKNSGKILEKLS